MKSFRMVMPETTDEALAALPTGGWDEATTRVLAGGQDLLTEMKEHLVEPERLVNIKGLSALRGKHQEPGEDVAIGALVTLAQLARDEQLRASYPLLCEAAESIASPQIRTLATLGGNLCQRPRCVYYRNEHAVCLKKGGDECFSYGGYSKYNAILGGGPSYIVHPSDMAPALVASDARVFVQSPRSADVAGGERSMALQALYTLPSEGDVTRETVLAPNELVTYVTVPARLAGWRSTYLKFQERTSFDFALASVALACRMEGDVIAEARLCLGGVAPIPWRCESTEQLLVGRRIDDETCRAAGEDALAGAEPLEHNGYKVPLTKGLITKALRTIARG